MIVRKVAARAIALLLLLPAGLICVAFPVYLLAATPDGRTIMDDTRAAMGAGTPSALRPDSVECDRERYGASRRGGTVEYACVITLIGAAPPRPAPTRPSVLPRTGYEYTRLERSLSSDRSGELPEVRQLSAAGEPQRLGLVWGGDEIAWRWGHWLMINALFLGFGAVALFAARGMWRRW